MSRMIPPHIPPTTESAAERTLFDEFARACPDEWTVLHSLDLARRGAGPFGEIDFVVIAPGLGFLTIEAKTYLERTPDGLWRTSPTEPPHERSPFEQAASAMYRIRDWLSDHRLPEVLGASVVVVPGMEIRNKDQIEWAPWQLIDRPRYRSKSLEQLVCEAFDAQRGSLSHPPAPLSRETAERVVRVLRGELEAYVSPKARIEQQLDEVRRFTDEQFRALDQIADNPRLLVNGLAGTGKTVLAIECARRAVEDGRRVLFVCFNRLLAEWLAEQTALLGARCTTVTIHDFMQGLVGEEYSPTQAYDYWERDLPERVFDELAERSAAGTLEFYDELIIDEAQDILLNGSFVTVLDSVLAQGLSRGRWRVFGDFSCQDIFGRIEESPREMLGKTIGFEPPLVRLTENCRNLPRVAHLAGAIAPDDGGAQYAECLRGDDGIDPRVVFYDGAKTERKALIEALDGLVGEGFEPGQIVVLSRRNVARCLAASIAEQPWSDRLRPVADAARGYTGYDSIFRFKGREAPAVVVTDIDPLDGSPRWSDEYDVRSLLYVAATRPLSRLVLLVHETWRGVLPLGPMDGTGLNGADVARERAGLAAGDSAVDRATELATRAHAGMVDKSGAPYIEHPLRVAEKLDSPEAKTVALLHDVLEDTEIVTEAELREQFGDEITDAVVAITHPKGEPDEQYYARVRLNPLAMEVKMADIHDNLEPWRRAELDPQKAAELAVKYGNALLALHGQSVL